MHSLQSFIANSKIVVKRTLLHWTHVIIFGNKEKPAECDTQDSLKSCTMPCRAEQSMCAVMFPELGTRQICLAYSDIDKATTC